MKVLFLNSLPKSFQGSKEIPQIIIQYASKESVKAFIDLDADQVVSYIGHSKTVDAINNDLGINLTVSREKAVPSFGDMIVVSSFDLPDDLPRGVKLTEDELVALPISYRFVGTVLNSGTFTTWQ